MHPPEVELMPSPSEYPHALDPQETKMAEKECADPHSRGVQGDLEVSKAYSAVIQPIQLVRQLLRPPSHVYVCCIKSQWKPRVTTVQYTLAVLTMYYMGSVSEKKKS